MVEPQPDLDRSAHRIVVVPGLAVHGYAEGPVQRLRAWGYRAELRPSPAWRGMPTDLERYGRELAAELDGRGQRVSVLVGLSAGTQAAAVAATFTSLVDHLVLVSPTIDPDKRSMPKEIAVWLRGDPHESGTFFRQVPDWARAGIPRILRGFSSAVALPLEEVLPRVGAALTLVHGEYDPLTAYEVAARLAVDNDGRLLVAPGQSHSWPQDDPEGFRRLMDHLVSA
jgi:pimeloyl-ACP methyl ester carboxylesterase